MAWRFEDYTLLVGRTNVGSVPYAGLEEFFALVGTGSTHEEAIANLRTQYEKRIALLLSEGEPIPPPGSGPGRARFASNEKIEALRPLTDEFWSAILGTSYESSYVSDESRLDAWEHYVEGARDGIVARVQGHFGVDISAYYDESIPVVLTRLGRSLSSPGRSRPTDRGT